MGKTHRKPSCHDFFTMGKEVGKTVLNVDAALQLVGAFEGLRTEHIKSDEWTKLFASPNAFTVLSAVEAAKGIIAEFEGFKELNWEKIMGGMISLAAAAGAANAAKWFNLTYKGTHFAPIAFAVAFTLKLFLALGQYIAARKKSLAIDKAFEAMESTNYATLRKEEVKVAANLLLSKVSAATATGQLIGTVGGLILKKPDLISAGTAASVVDLFVTLLHSEPQKWKGILSKKSDTELQHSARQTDDQPDEEAAAAATETTSLKSPEKQSSRYGWCRCLRGRG